MNATEHDMATLPKVELRGFFDACPAASDFVLPTEIDTWATVA